MLKQSAVFLLCAMCFELGFAQPVQLIIQRDSSPSYEQYVDGNYYEIVPFKGTWQAAKADAENRLWQGRQGHLATLHTPEEIQFIAAQPFFQTCLQDATCQADYTNGLWLGGYQSPDATQADGNWNWVTGEDWTIRLPYLGLSNYWHQGEPNDNSDAKLETHLEDYLTLTLFGTLNDMAGQQVLSGYVVEYDLRGWVQWRTEDGGNGHWYALKRNYVSFPGALVETKPLSWQGMPVHLATLTSAEERTFVFNHFLDLAKDPLCAVGFYTMGCNLAIFGRVYWVGGQYNNYGEPLWITGEPDESSVQRFDYSPVGSLAIIANGNLVKKPDALELHGSLIEAEPTNFPSPLLAAPSCYAENILALPHYDEDKQQLELPHLLVHTYDTAYLRDMGYYYKAVLKKDSTPEFRFIVAQLELFEPCQSPMEQRRSSRFSRFLPEQQKEPYYSGDTLTIPYIQVGQAWYSVTLRYAPQNWENPLTPVGFVIESINPLDSNTIPQTVLDAFKFLATR